MCEKSDYISSKEAVSRIKYILKQKYEHRDKNFANAREVRNLYEALITCQADRLFNTQNSTREELMRFERVAVDNAEKLCNRYALLD